MKMILFVFLFSISAWAKQIVLVSYFDAFGNAPFNNSEVVAQGLSKRFANHPELELRICSLQTVFDKSFYELQNCINELPKPPSLVLGLGEYGCKLKVETIIRNFDHTEGPDNDGIERKNSPIFLDGPSEIGLNYPLPAMYCALQQDERKSIEISNNAGSFVCNNVAYQFTNTFHEIPFGFIHVMAHDCSRLAPKTQEAIGILSKMILKASSIENIERLKTKKQELQELRKKYSTDECLKDFYQRTKGIDEKGLWPFSWIK
jgi:pyrrolidone-carboxylate peptidase